LRKTSSSLTRGVAARRGSFTSFRAIARTMTSSRLSPSIGPDHDFPSFGISVDHPLYFTDDLFGTLLRNAQNPRRIVHGHRPTVINPDRLPHMFIINPRSKLRTFYRPTPPRTRVRHSSPTLRSVGFHNPIPLRIWEAPRPGRARLQSCRNPTL
jgi:hypothetical protein